MIDAEELQAQAQRRELIRLALASGDRVVMRMHPHLHAPGYAVYVEHGELRIYACTLVVEPLPVVIDTDIVAMGAERPEETVHRWLCREFSDNSLERVSIERYVEAKT